MLADALNNFKASVSQCGKLIENSHQTTSTHLFLLPELDRSQIAVAAFLNIFVAWETFLEESLVGLMTGNPTISTNLPTKYVSPPNAEMAHKLLVGTQRYFDYGNCDYVRKMVGLYFKDGYPFEPHLSAITTDLNDLRTMRNASAHITSSTQNALESLAQRIFSTPHPGIELYSLLIAPDPRSPIGNTVFAEFREKLLIVAELIATG